MTKNDEPALDLSFCEGPKKSGKATNSTLPWLAFMDRYRKPLRTKEARADFSRLGLMKQLDLKSRAGWIIGGHSTDGRRQKSSIASRSVIGLDVEGEDFTPAMLASLLDGTNPLCRFEWMLHTTCKHTPEAPRVRIFIPLANAIPVADYEPLARFVAATLDPTLDSVDGASFAHSQVMFNPVCFADGEYIFHHNAGELPGAEEFLGPWTKTGSRDYAKLPFSKKRTAPRERGQKMQDPTEKTNFVGTFCRAYPSMEEVLALFLSDVYASTASDDRYSYIHGSGGAAAIVYDDLFLCSHHDTDPANGTHNAFDLVRIHRFGELDEKVDPDTAPGNMPSYKKMEEHFKDDPRVAGELKAEGDAVVEEFEIGAAPDDSQAAVGQSPLDFMNANHALAQLALGKVVVLTFDDHGGHGFSTTHDLTTLYRNRPSPKAKSQKTFGVWWLDHPQRRTYPGGVVFKPGENTEPHAFNLFRGWSVKRDPDHSKCRLILNHVREVLAGGDEERADYILNWSAHLVQRPQEKPEVAIGLNGLKGTGKDTYAVALGKLCKAHYTVITKMEHLTGRFNSHELQALLIHCPDAVWGGDRGAVGALNNLITGAETMIDQKGIAAFNIDSFCRLFLTSNEEWFIPSSPDERRWAVFDVSDKYRHQEAYFGPLWQEIDGGVPHGIGPGIPALFDFLMMRDLSKFNPRRFPQTEGLARQKANSLKGADKFIHELLTEGELPAATNFDAEGWADHSVQVERASLQAIYEDWHRKQKYPGEIASPVSLGKRLHHFIEGLEDTQPRIDGVQKRFYVFPPLGECREQFAKKMGSPLKWPNEALNDGNDLI